MLYATTVEIEELGEKVVRAGLLVETESQKHILVGKGGSMVREIGTRARPEFEAILGRPVFLDLQVKVRPRWRRDAATLDRLGLGGDGVSGAISRSCDKSSQTRDARSDSLRLGAGWPRPYRRRGCA